MASTWPGACAIGLGSLLPLFAEERYHFTPLAAGSLLSARAVVELGSVVLASAFMRRVGWKLPLMSGSILLAIGMILFTVAPPIPGPFRWLALSAGLTGAGIGLSAPAASRASLEIAPNDLGAISGLRGMFRQAGVIVGICATTAYVARSSGGSAALGRGFIAVAAALSAVTMLTLLASGGAPHRS
jgi:MFS family permease